MTSPRPFWRARKSSNTCGTIRRGRRCPRAHPRVPRRAAHHAAVPALPRAAASALSDSAEDRAHARAAPSRHGRGQGRPAVVYASNHKSHTDYLVEPLVLDDNGIRPPLIAAGINLFGGPLGLIHRHVTGAIPIRRNTQGSGLPHHAQGLRRGDPEEARSLLLPGGRPQLQRRAEAGEDRPGARGAHRRLPTWSSSRRRSPTTWCSRTTSWRGSGSRSSSGRSRASWPRWCATRSATDRARSSPSARRFRSPTTTRSRAPRCSS